MRARNPDPSLPTTQPLAASGGVSMRPATPRDPYEALDDLMAAVEALCPRWPARKLFKGAGVWVL